MICRNPTVCSQALFFALVLAAFGLTAGSAQAQQKIDVENDSRYVALTWVQNSAEYKLMTEQTYRMALSQLYVGMEDSNWTADEVQLAAGGFEKKPPAVILDCDETVLDNSAYNARNVLKNEPYSTEKWNAWCQESQAEAIPGALEFIKRAEALGVKVFYITNRRDVVKEATIKNLKNLGFPASEETLLTKNEDLGRGDDKITRRAMVAKDHRIVLLIGDSMSDLCDGMAVPNTNRRNEIAEEKVSMLGSRWIILPNPVYGGWQRALRKAEKALDPKLVPKNDSEQPQVEEKPPAKSTESK